MAPDEMEEIVGEFLVESTENIDELDRSLLVLETNPSDRRVLAAVFRSIHTIKGASGFLGFERLTGVTHAAESLLADLRDGALVLTPEGSGALFATVDAVRDMLRAIESGGNDGVNDYGALIADLRRLREGTASVSAPAPAALAPSTPPAVAETAPAPLPEPPIDAPPLESPLAQLAEAVLAAVPADLPAPEPPAVVVPEPPATVVPEAPSATRETADDPSPTPAASSVSDGPANPALATIRVGVTLLDKLMNLVGELVLARNQILQCTAKTRDTTFVSTAQRLNMITTDLQESVMKTRMQPIGTVWNKFPRVVRDLALVCGKQMTLEMDGADTELDRTVIEAITDPLTHLIRNAIDHGIESPEVRAAAGKPAKGRLTLRAFHEGGHVHIEIIDDGRGIDRNQIREKARAKGLLKSTSESRMSERDFFNLIFSPGFSTAAEVTDISGRGVGLDVVKTNIERIGGTVDVTSQFGSGTTFKVKIPLTLAIIPALIVVAGGDRYAMSQVNLVELVRVREGGGPGGIEYVHGVPVHRLRGNLLPLVDLAFELGVRPARFQCADPDGMFSVVVLQALDRQFGLIIDEVHDTEEIVVKPLGRQLKEVETFAGATIMGDGRVALILDVMGLAHRSGVMADIADPADRSGPESIDAAEDARTLVVVKVNGDRRMAIPLSAVSRLEEFDTALIEVAAGAEVVQYRDRILPLVRLGASPVGPAPTTETVQVIVNESESGAVGLVVDDILDIVEERLVMDHSRSAPGISGSAIVAGRVTDIVDVESIVAAAARRQAVPA